MQVIDLSRPITPEMPVFPGDPSPEIRIAASLKKEGCVERLLTLSSHTGTHVDAPAHLLSHGNTIDALPLEAFCGQGEVVDCRPLGSKPVSLDFLKQTGCMSRPMDFILLYTGWDAFWGGEKYFSGFPVLTPEAAEWLIQAPIKGVGVDALSIDAVDSEDLPVHNILLGQKVLIIENLANLGKLPAGDFIFCCFPLAIERGDGSPVRAAAIVGL
ncbi:Kynurenine formamidase [Desulfatibacillum alkenivorans DSM 16219]|jgi:kynurenine formamidase|uniref:Kynurenine formamidase n=1 Tax=Desulfatibacillum alkenivorans DSM 16219 TaxID=1121393 RepID=A0A1M6GGC8_9BACT|nr:cyclase family protein [Desulfatibacillum alkenivorans]SHJ09020.1 Kynurenine formamidase [Desulfatibacillum alkenivorans DSM 16219]